MPLKEPQRPTRLTKAFCTKVTAPGKYGEPYGHGLQLLVGSSGSKSWIQRVKFNGKWNTLGLGSLRYVGLAEARDIAYLNHMAARQGTLEVEPRRRRSKAKHLRVMPTFAEAAQAEADRNAERWSERHLKQWIGRLRHNVFPSLGAVKVEEITLDDIVEVLRPISATETGKKVRQGIFSVMAWAVAHKHRETNPVDDATLDRLLKPRAKRTEHRPAVEHAALGDILRTIRESGERAGATLCLEFTALTAARSGEARGATWDELDLDAKLWTIPADRMKAGDEHTVPLSDAALAVLDEARNAQRAAWPDLRVGAGSCPPRRRPVRPDARDRRNRPRHAHDLPHMGG